MAGIFKYLRNFVTGSGMRGHLETVLCIDTSIKDNTLYQIRRAVTNMLHVITQSRTNERITLVEFCQETNVPFTSSVMYDRICDTIDSFRTSPSVGMPNLASALREAVRALSEGNFVQDCNQVELHPRIIIITEGLTNSEDEVEKLVDEMIAENGIPIIGIGVNSCNKELMQRIADATGGMFTYCDGYESLNATLMQHTFLGAFIQSSVGDTKTLYSSDKIVDCIVQATTEAKTSMTSIEQLNAFCRLVRAIATIKVSRPKQRQAMQRLRKRATEDVLKIQQQTNALLAAIDTATEYEFALAKYQREVTNLRQTVSDIYKSSKDLSLASSSQGTDLPSSNSNNDKLVFHDLSDSEDTRSSRRDRTSGRHRNPSSSPELTSVVTRSRSPPIRSKADSSSSRRDRSTREERRRRGTSRSPNSKRGSSPSKKRSSRSPSPSRKKSRSPIRRSRSRSPSKKSNSRSSRSPTRRDDSPSRRSTRRSSRASPSPRKKSRSPSPSRKKSRSPTRRSRSRSPSKKSNSRSSRSPNRRGASPSPKSKRGSSPSKKRSSRSPSPRRNEKSPRRSKSPPRSRKSNKLPSPKRKSPTRSTSPPVARSKPKPGSSKLSKSKKDDNAVTIGPGQSDFRDDKAASDDDDISDGEQQVQKRSSKKGNKH